MKYLVDYHVHTNNSFDSRVTVEEYCKKAVLMGIKEIAFTEHFDLNPNDAGLGLFDYEKYTGEIAKCQEIYGEKLTIKKALELGEPHLYIKEHKDFLKDKDFDFFLGSVHYLGDVLLDAPFDLEEKELYRKYFEEVLGTVEKGNFHILGHLDVLKRYVPKHFGRFQALDYEEIIKEILKIIIRRDKGIEINTSGFRQGLGESLPTIEVLQWYFELGGEILTIGSDAHYINDLGRDLEIAIRIAKEIGFKSLSTFNKGKVNFIEL